MAKALVAFAALLCFGTATALADSINLSEVTENKTVADGTTLTGTLGANVKISIADGATVTLDGVAINGANDEDCSWAGITCAGDATIILEGTNTVKGFYENYPGIYVPEGSTLTIKGDGSLDASSNGYGAGIGGGSGIACGNIVIEGGNIVATGGYLAAGIGGGGNVSCGAITIADTVTKVVATKHELNTPRSIGMGVNGTCGTVTIGGTVYPDGITQSPYIYPTYTATLKDGTEDAANWTITPSEGLSESNTVTVAYAGTNKVKSVKAVKKAPVTYPLLSEATAEDVGKVVCADGHLHDAKTAVPDGCTAVGILGKVTKTGNGLILALQDATSQTWNTINGWTSATDFAGTTLKVLPDDDARGANLTSYTKLGGTAVSDWAVAQKSDYEAIFVNLGSATGDSDGKVYDANVNAYITTVVGGTAISGNYWSATGSGRNEAWRFRSTSWQSYEYDNTDSFAVRPVLGFGGEAAGEVTEEIEIAVTPVEGETNVWTFQMPAANVVVEVEYVVPTDLSTVTEAYTAQDGETLTGTLGANVKITIADGATVTLKDVTITNLGNGCHWAGINCPGDAILVLEGANTVCAGGNGGGYHNYPGIWIAPEKTLTIRGDGSLTAYSGTGNAGWGSGIGGGYEIDCGNIVIEGGVITATGGKSAAGIGCGYYGACGDITITGGTIVSTGGTYSSALGGGCGATCGDITIAATVTSLTATSTPTSGAVSDCIGAGSEGGTCGTVTIGGVTGPVLDSPFTFMPVDLAGLTEDTTIPDGAALCGTLAGNVKISIAPGAKVTLNGADINGDGTWTDGDYAGITCEGEATIILRGENNVKGFNADYPGIYVPEGSTLTIQGEGALDASSNGAGAGIGGGNGIACGNIVIAGGVITATGGTEAAGIGGGSGAACGDITITDASFGVTATKGEDAPYSIGAGKDGTGGTVTIGNEVGAIEDSPYTCNPPIDLSNVTEARTIPDGKTITGTLGATVKISIARNATVTLKDATINGVHNTEHYYAWSWAGITCEGDATIILEGENAVRGFCADYPGIFVPEGSTLTIQGEGSLDASSNGWGAGIGAGDGSEYYISCGNIVIEGGTIVATGGKYAAAIGSGEYSDCGTITIADSVTSVTAIKGDNAPYSIGAGSDGSCGTVTIGGTVYPDGIAESPYIYPTYTATLKDGTEDAANWTITPNEGLVESNTVTVAYAGENKVKSVKAKNGTDAIAVTPVTGKTNEWTFVMPAADVVVEVEYFAVATFEVEGETYAVTTNVVGEAVATPSEDPVKIGHTFAGWFTEATGGTQVTDETLMGIADTTFYAQFRAPILTIENGVLTAVDFNGCTNLALTIPDTVTAIGDSAFYQCTGLASVTIPGSVKTISHAAFRDCTALTSVTIEEGVTTIGERAFARCVNLASITIPGTVTDISEAAFSDCKSLVSLTIPGSVKTIGPQAFQNCTGLESVTLEEGVETIERVAFDGCENLSSVTIPDSVTSIGKDAFAGCSDALYEEGSGNLSGVKLVDGWAVGYDKASISENLDLTGVRGIAGGAFAGCDVITSVIIPDGVATISEYVFNGCDNLTGVTIPDSVTSIGEGAFGGCDNLASVTIPDSVTSIGKDAFEGCSEELFDTTTLTGVALVDGWAVGYTDALPENLDLDGARGIADNAFRESALESVTIPGTVARVPAGAFMSCSSLASVTLEEGVTAIDDSAFIECSALESVEIPDTVTAIGPQAFVACAKLASVTVPGSVAEIGPAAYGMCSSLTNVTLEAGVTNIGMMAFAMCSALESLELPGTVTAIGAQAFMMSMNLASVTIPSSVMEIGQDAFLYTALATVNVDYGDGERVKALLAASGLDVSGLTFVEPYKLTFDPDGGEFAEGVETNRFLYAGEEFGELPEATRTGYTLAGWFTAATNGYEVAATNKMDDADATVYAQWTINQYTISFNVNGGEGEFDSITLDYGSEYGELPEPVNGAWDFLGWFDEDGNLATAESVLGDSDVVLTARWSTGAMLTVGEYFSMTLTELGVPVPTDGTVYSVKALGLPAGLKLKSNPASTTKVEGKTVSTKAKTTWWIEGVPTAALDYATNPAYVVVTVGKDVATYPLKIAVTEQEVVDLGELPLKGEPFVYTATEWLEGIEATGWTVSGLPSGVHYTEKGVGKTAPSNSVYGVATKAGLFTITAKKKTGSYYETLQFKVVVRPPAADESVFGKLADRTSTVFVEETWNLADDVAAQGGEVVRVSGLPAGMKFSKNDVYAYSNTVKRTGRYVKQAANTIAGAPTKPGTYVVSLTKNVKEGSRTVAKTAEMLWTVEEAEPPALTFNTSGGVIVAASTALAYDGAFAFEADPAAVVKASGLPSGIKLVNLGDGSYAFSGYTSRTGTYLATITAKLNGQTVTERVAMVVDPLPAWATGTFDGYVTADGKSVSGIAATTIGTSGQVSGKLQAGGKTWNFSAPRYTGLEDGKYTVKVDAKCTYSVRDGAKSVRVSETRSFLLSVSEEDGRGALAMTEVPEDAGLAAYAWQNLWNTTYKEVGNAEFTGKNKMVYKTWTDVEAEGLGEDDTLALKVTTRGVVTVTYRYFKGTYDGRGDRQYTSFTSSTVFVPWSYEEGVLTGTVFVYFPPNEATGFPGWQGRIDYPWDQD